MEVPEGGESAAGSQRTERDLVLTRHSHGLGRPLPSNTLPVPLLHIPVSDNRPVPSPRDRKRRKLRKLLGAAYNPKFVSVKEPKEHRQFPDGRDEFSKNSRRLHWDTFKKLRFRDSTGKNKVRVKSRRNRRLLRRFLARYTACPVRYRWVELDEYHWPRWLKIGQCDPNRPCSLPRGMGCHAHGYINVTLLLWNCRADRSCDWLPYQYPVVNTCKCACANN